MVITHLVLYQGGWFWNIKNSEKDRFQHLELYSEPCQTSKIEHFAWKVNSFFMLTIFGKHSMLDLRSPSWWGFWICNWHHYISNYCAAIFIVNIIFTAGSLILLYLVSTFHIGFIKINSPFPKLFFFSLLCLALADLLLFNPLSNLNSAEVKSQKHWWILYKIINADRYITACYNTLVLNAANFIILIK